MINFEEVFDFLKIGDGDNLLINSDIKKILINYKGNEKKFDPSKILDVAIKKIGKNGTLLLPTFNWDFCSGKDFDYLNTPSRSGSLTKIALSRKEFKRTKNPIYSFAVYGKNKNYLSNLSHDNSFDLNSPFGFLIKNKGKNLFIDIDYKDSLTFVHVAEQKIGVSYRYIKKFSANYIDELRNKKLVDCNMYVRNEEFQGVTFIDKKMDLILEEKKAIKSIVKNNISFTLIDIPVAYEIMLQDIKKEGKIIYPKKNV